MASKQGSSASPQERVAQCYDRLAEAFRTEGGNMLDLGAGAQGRAALEYAGTLAESASKIRDELVDPITEEPRRSLVKDLEAIPTANARSIAARRRRHTKPGEGTR